MDLSILLQQLCQLPDVDVLVVNGAPLEFQGRIISEGVLLYAADKDFRVAYETLTLKRFLDFQPVADAYREIYFTRRRAELASEAHHILQKNLGDLERFEAIILDYISRQR